MSALAFEIVRDCGIILLVGGALSALVWALGERREFDVRAWDAKRGSRGR